MVKLALAEPESAALARVLHGATRWTSQIGRVEFERAVRRSLDDCDALIGEVLETIDVLPVHASIAAFAAQLRPSGLRTLDAIHLATMRAIGADLDVAYVYDERLAAAAARYGIPVDAPSEG